MMRLLVQLVLLPLPWALRRPLLNLMRGWSLHPRSRIGKSVILADEVVLDEGAVIGHLTYAKGLTRLEMAKGSFIGNLDWITAVPRGTPRHYAHQPERNPHFTLEEEARITHRHFVDCTGGVRIGRFSNVGGWHCQIMSHSLEIASSRLDAEEITVGAYCFVGSRCILLKGAALPDYSVVTAGSVYGNRDKDAYGLYRGNPAVRERELPPRLKYFKRTDGFIV